MKQRVLVVDDNDDVRELLMHILRAQDLQPYGAPDAVSALQILDSQPIDLVLLDVMMPGISGIELLTRIRNGESTYQKIPIAMITALSAQDEIAKAIEAGATTYLVKPFRSADIHNLIARVFAGTHEEKEGI